MAKLTIGQKAHRVLLLLLGLRNPKIAAILAKHGFTDEDLAEGWALLRAITRTRLDTVPSGGPTPIYVDPTTLATLDEWENKWFPIAKATLQRRAPKVHDWMFLNLAQAEGPQVIITVGTFIDRWELLDKPKDKGGYGPGGKEAKKLLDTRGLRPDVVKEAKALLEILTSVASGPPSSDGSPGPAAQPESFEAAEAALWAFYLEWGPITRTVIKDRRMLKALGFLKGGGAGDDGGDDGEEEGDDEDEEGAAAGEEAAAPKPAAAPAAKPKKKGGK